MTPLWLAWLGAAQAAVQRFALLVANNEGAPGSELLVFAESDAEKLAHLLRTSGHLDPKDIHTVAGGSRNDVLFALGELRTKVAAAATQGDDTVVLFYYSGHADDERLQLGRTWLGYDELDQALQTTGADVRIALLDACQSGAMTRSKGAIHAPGFVVDMRERLDASGQVVITSSAGDEASQESDEIGGSYFTHYLSSALRGSGDDNQDGLVTLTEAYRYVYRETVFRTSSSRSGTQHPSYDWDLAGAGDLVLSDLREPGAALVFPTSMTGRFAVYDEGRRQFVAEVAVQDHDERVALPPGTYLVQERQPTHLDVATIRLREGDEAHVDAVAFQAVAYEQDVAKGQIAKTLRKAKQPKTSVHLLLGGRGASDDTIDQEYLPRMPAAGAALRWRWRDGRWLGGDLTSGATSSALTLTELGYQVPVSVSGSELGLGAGYITAPRLFQLGAGVRLSGVYLRRVFPDRSVPTQDLLTVSPGLTVFGGVHPGRMALELELRQQYVPYFPDAVGKSLSFGEAYLTLGYLF